MTVKSDIEALKEQARAIENRLLFLNRRVREIEQVFAPSVLVAIVDTDKCRRCGICQDICPMGAISVEENAMVDTKQCTGCALCVQQCPQDALSLHPIELGYRQQARGNL